MTKIKRIVCLFGLLLATTSAVAQQATGTMSQSQAAAPAAAEALTEAQVAQSDSIPGLYRLGNMYKQKGEYDKLVWAMKRLITLLPNNGDLKLTLATAYALQGEKTKTYDTLLNMQKQGFGYDIGKDPNFAKVSETKVWKYVVDNLAANLKSFGEGKVAFTLPLGDTLFESLAYDPARKQFLVGSVRDGTVSLVGKNGKLTDFIKPDASNGLWSVYAMAADPEDDALYVASTASVYYKGFEKADFGKAGVFKFRLSTGKLLQKYLLMPDSKPRTLSSIAVGKKGQVFAADGLRSTIYRLDGGELKAMLGNPKLTSLRGLAVSGDGKTLYFADYALGVFGVDLAAGKGFDLAYDPAKLVLGGIDGLYWYDNNLVVIENGMSPTRVMRLGLDAEGRKIVKAIPLDAQNPAFGLPTYGTIDGDGLYFIANSQKVNYGAYGTPKEGAKLEGVRVFRSDLRFAWDKPGIPTQPGAPTSPPAAAPVSTPGTGVFGNVEGGVESTPAQ